MTGFHAPPSPTERRRRAERRRAVLLLAGSIAALLTVGVVALRAAIGRVDLDPETMCPNGRRSEDQVVVLLDVTDPYSSIQREFVVRTFERLQEELPDHAELSLYALRAPAKARLQPEMRLCNPGSGRDASWLWQNPERLRRRWENGFRRPLAELLKEALHAPAARTSPIMEQIQAASVAVFDGAREEAHLLIVSDMLQNSDSLRMYNGRLDFAAFHDSPAFERVRCDLPGVKVRILYVLRADSPYLKRKRSHIEFWERYFDSCGARIEGVDIVPGLGGADGE